jgi:glycosyltransferase involved in cell wall biosynthesis
MREEAMKNKPLVTVIMIFLNAEKFIEEAIESVVGQSYTEWELLLVDDGSTDTSTDTALRYAEQYPQHVRYLQHAGHENLGKSTSRNLGISEARGEYIAFLDADDVWMAEKLEQQVEILDAQPDAAMLYGRTQKWFGWTGDPEDIQKDSLTQLAVEPETLAQPPLLLTRFLENEHVYPCTCSMLVRRETFEKIGMFEESFRDAYEDMVFHSKVFLKAPVYVSGKCWDRYRRHPDNSWKRAVTAGLYDPLNPNPLRRMYLIWVESYLLQEGVNDQKVWRTLRKELWPYRHPVLYRLSRNSRTLMLEATEFLKSMARRVLPVTARHWLKNQFSTGK